MDRRRKTPSDEASNDALINLDEIVLYKIGAGKSVIQIELLSTCMNSEGSCVAVDNIVKAVRTILAAFCTVKVFLTTCVLKSTDCYKSIESVVCFLYTDSKNKKGERACRSKLKSTGHIRNLKY
jgi:hypothetical protein